MPRIEWDKIGEKEFEVGVSKLVLFPMTGSTYGKGVAWNGVTAVNENPSGAEPTKMYANNSTYGVMYSVEEYGATIEAYMYPKEFAECDGSKEIVPGMYIGQQNRKPFGYAYRTEVGNDTEGIDHAYKLHFVYGAMASPSEKAHSSVNENVDAETLSWEITTTPVTLTTVIGGVTLKPTAHVEIRSDEVDPDVLKAIEDLIYGTDDPAADAKLPSPDELYALINA